MPRKKLVHNRLPLLPQHSLRITSTQPRRTTKLHQEVSRHSNLTDNRSETSTGENSCTMPEFLRYFLRLGTFGFGGPIALAGYMQRDLVEDRRWITKEDYMEGLALAQLAPGPLAAQLAIYLGWLRGGVMGATLVAVAFVLPSFLMVLGLSALYVRFGGMPWMQGVFYGIGASVIAIIGRSACKLIRITLSSDVLLWSLFAVSALATAWTESELVWVFVLSGVIALAVKWRPRLMPPMTLLSLSPVMALLLGSKGWHQQGHFGRCSGSLRRLALLCLEAGWPSFHSCTVAW